MKDQTNPGKRVIKAIKISRNHADKLEQIRDVNRKFNLSGEVEKLIDRIHLELVKN